MAHVAGFQAQCHVFADIKGPCVRPQGPLLISMRPKEFLHGTGPGWGWPGGAAVWPGQRGGWREVPPA